MNTLVLAVALFLLANLVVALIVAARGPTSADRMLMALLIGTTGTGILMLLAQAMHLPALVDVALVLALSAAGSSSESMPPSNRSTTLRACCR